MKENAVTMKTTYTQKNKIREMHFRKATDHDRLRHNKKVN